MENATQFIDQKNGLVFDRASSVLLATEVGRDSKGAEIERIDLYRAASGVYFLVDTAPGEADYVWAIPEHLARRCYDGEKIERHVEAEFPDYAKRDEFRDDIDQARESFPIWMKISKLRANQDAMQEAWKALDEAEAEFPTTEESTVSQEVDEREAVVA